MRANVDAGHVGWTNNGCESANAVLKRQIGWKPQQIPDLIEELRTVVEHQHREADRALMQLGQYSLRPCHRHHVVPREDWRKMSEPKRNELRRKCFCVQRPVNSGVSVSTDGSFGCTYRPCAGRKLNQRRRAAAERTTTTPKRRRKAAP